MHRPIQDHLEEFLSDPYDSKIPPDFHEHLAACTECAREMETLQSQTSWLRLLRKDPPIEMNPGFFARVMNRVEEQSSSPVWSALLDPVFGRRLAYACLALVVVLGGYLLHSEPGRTLNPVSGIVSSMPATNATLDDGVQPAQRDAVLVNLASFRE
jgi:anti-sigma factor RsiW